MKRLTVLLLMVMLVPAMSTTAFAAEGNIKAAGGSQTIDVSARYIGNATTPTVYSVDLAWDDMSFTYTAAGTQEWNPGNHSYTDNTTASWSDGMTITVTNHSNAAVSADFTYAASEGFTAATGSFTASTLSLATAVDTTVAGAPKSTTTFSLSGTLPNTQTTSGKIGTITVTLT